MTYNLAPANAPWFEHLTDSVRALGEAAREWQLADRAAVVAEGHLRLQSRVLHEGKATHQPGPDTVPLYRRTRTHVPHTEAFFELRRIYWDHRCLTRTRYRQAAMLYASGAAWAVARVQAGEQPPRVAFDLDHYERPEPVPHPYQVEGLDGYVHAAKVERAHERLVSMDVAFEHAEEIAGRADHDVSERDAGEMFDAADHARGLQDAAYTYGHLVEQALGYVLLGPKDAHRKELAEQLAAQEKAAPAEEGQG